MSTDNPTPEGEPLHTATLLAVLAKLRDRLTAIPALIAEDTADHPLTDCEVAEWNARVEALEGFAADVALMLKDVNPRARVVVLPEPYDEFGGPSWLTDTGNVRVDQRGRIYADGPRVRVSAMRWDQCERFATVLLAAAVAGGAL